MNIGYNVLIVSDKQNDILDIQSKMNISRSMDTVISCPLDKTVEFSRKYQPGVVILFAHKKDEKLFEICKIIRQDPHLKHISIIFIFDEFNEEFILASLTAGINDYIVSPIKKIDILAHLSWCLKKNELIRELEFKTSMLKELGVIDKVTGLYLSSFSNIVFNYHINNARRNGRPLIFMAVSPDLQHKNKINNEYLSKAIKKTSRNTDVAGISDDGVFFVLLPETELKGGYTFYNKLIKNLGNMFTISAGFCESFSEMDYESLKFLSLKALSEAMANGGNRVFVCNSDLFKAEVKNIPQKSQGISPGKQENHNQEERFPSDQQKNWIDKIQVNKKSYDYFRKEFKKKVHEVIAPVFYKMRDNLKIKYPTSIIIDHDITETKCSFSVKEIFKGTESIVQIIDPGLSYVKMEHYLIKEGKQSVTRYNIELNDITEKYLGEILQDLLNEFEIVSDLERLVKNDPG
jgi:DNA-binding response OmpR family regulator